MGYWPVILTAVLWGAGTIWYFYLVVRDEIKPALAPWIIMSATMLLGLVSFWLSPNPTLASGIGFAAGMFSTFPLLGVVIYKIGTQKRQVSFNRFQKGCLWAAAGIVVIWILMKFALGGQTASFIANILTQVLMVIGYTALAERLWFARSRVESLFFWTTIFLGGAFSLVIPFREGNWLGIIYGFRALITAGITVGLLLRIEFKMRRMAYQGASVT